MTDENKADQVEQESNLSSTAPDVPVETPPAEDKDDTTPEEE